MIAHFDGLVFDLSRYYFLEEEVSTDSARWWLRIGRAIVTQVVQKIVFANPLLHGEMLLGYQMHDGTICENYGDGFLVAATLLP